MVQAQSVYQRFDAIQAKLENGEEVTDTERHDFIAAYKAQQTSAFDQALENRFNEFTEKNSSWGEYFKTSNVQQQEQQQQPQQEQAARSETQSAEINTKESKTGTRRKAADNKND